MRFYSGMAHNLRACAANGWTGPAHRIGATCHAIGKQGMQSRYGDKAVTSRCNSAATRRFRPRRTRPCSTACQIRIRTRIMWRASPSPNSPSCARSPASRISPRSSSTTCRRAWLVESKSLKLYLNSFRNHGAFHEDCTVDDRQDGSSALLQAEMAAHRRLFPSARRHADRRVLAGGQAAGGVWVPDQGVATYRARG